MEPNSQQSTFWAKVAQTLKVIYKECLVLCVLGIVMPKLALEFTFGRYSHDIFMQLRGFEGNSDFLSVFSFLSKFLLPYFSSTLGFGLLCVIIYFSIIHIADDYYRGQPLPKISRALWRGLKSTVPKGIIAILLFSMGLLTSQIVFPPLVLFLLPGFMIPVLLVVHKKTTLLASFREAMSMSYGRRFPGGFWALMFKVMSIAAFFYFAVLLAFYGSEKLLVLDNYLPIPRGFFSTPLREGWPFTYAFLSAAIFKSLLLPLITTLLAVVTTSFYYWIIAHQSPLPPQGIEV